MKSTHKCLKEWNATIEALGEGIQSILIRNYKTSVNEFLLYPTTSYTLKKNYLESFQDKYKDFAQLNSLPQKKGDKVQIKYYATLIDIIERPYSRTPSDNLYIWTKNHVKNFITSQKAFVWVLRVYSLKNPYWAEPTPGAIKYANLKDDISIEGIEPVLTDSEFNQIIDVLK